MTRWGSFFKQNLQNVSELRLALCMTEFTVHKLSFQDNYADTRMCPLPMVVKMSAS